MFLKPFLLYLILPFYFCLPAPRLNGNPPSMQKSPYIENIIIPQNVINCIEEKYKPDSEGVWNLHQIADAFYEYGVKPWNFPNSTFRSEHINDCIAALIIVSGECQPVFERTGCSSNGSGKSGKIFL